MDFSKDRQMLALDFTASDSEHFMVYLSEQALVPAREDDHWYSLEALISEQLVFSLQEALCFATPQQLDGVVLF